MYMYVPMWLTDQSKLICENGICMLILIPYDFFGNFTISKLYNIVEIQLLNFKSKTNSILAEIFIGQSKIN